MIIYLNMIDLPEERSKFEQIYYNYRNLMYHIAYRVLKNNQDAEDAVQGTLMKIAENMGKVMEMNEFKLMGYIVTISKNTAIDAYRKRATQQALEFQDEWYVNDEPIYLSDELTRCIEKLPERKKTILLLKYYYGYNNDEIAKLLDITPANVAKIVYRAKVKLREYYEKEDVL